MKKEIDCFKVGLAINLVLFILAVVVSNALLDLLRPPMRDGVAIWWEIKDQIYGFLHGVATVFYVLYQSFWGGVAVSYLLFLLYYSLGYSADRSLTVFLAAFFLAVVVFLGGGLLWTSWAAAASLSPIFSDGYYVDRGELWSSFITTTLISFFFTWILAWIFGALAEQILGEMKRFRTT